jgi:hypothetical protein
VSITPSDSNFGSPSGGISSNSGTITFPMSTSGSQVITGAALLDGSGSSANILMFAALNASKTLTSGDTFSFPISNFTVTFS